MELDAAPQSNVAASSSSSLTPTERQTRFQLSSDRKNEGQDDALIRGISRGNERSFLLFYRRFAPGVYSMVLKILKDQPEAEDAVQEAFLQMWRRSATYDAARSKLFTWVIMIARGKAIDRLRALDSYSRATAAATEEIETMPSEQESNASDLLELTENRTRVRAAIEGLSKDQRVAIDLVFFGGMSQSEISRKLGQPLGTIKARIRRGLAALRGSLEREAIQARGSTPAAANSETVAA